MLTASAVTVANAVVSIAPPIVTRIAAAVIAMTIVIDPDDAHDRVRAAATNRRIIHPLRIAIAVAASDMSHVDHDRHVAVHDHARMDDVDRAMCIRSSRCRRLNS
jgi:ribonuclease PH